MIYYKKLVKANLNIILGGRTLDKLVNIRIGTTVKVEELLSDGYIRERMLALGLTKGATIDVIRRGPKDNLTLYNIRGTMIALRKEEGEKIIVSYI